MHDPLDVVDMPSTCSWSLTEHLDLVESSFCWRSPAALVIVARGTAPYRDSFQSPRVGVQ